MIDPCPTCTLTLAGSNPMKDRTYFLKDEALTYAWTSESFLQRDTLVDCGPLVVEIFYADETPYDESIFKQETLAAKDSFKVLKTDDLSIQQDYQFSYRAYYRDYSENAYEAEKTFTVTILDPCESPKTIS